MITMITLTKDGQTTQIPEGHELIDKLLDIGWVKE